VQINNYNTEKETKTHDFYVKTQIGKNHMKEEENSL